MTIVRSLALFLALSLLAVGVSAQTPLVQVHIWPQRAVVSMPVAGVVGTVPAAGTTSPTILDTFDFKSIADAYVEPAFDHADDEDLLTFDVRTGEGSRTRLSEELTTLRARVDEPVASMHCGRPATRCCPSFAARAPTAD